MHLVSKCYRFPGQNDSNSVIRPSPAEALYSLSQLKGSPSNAIVLSNDLKNETVVHIQGILYRTLLLFLARQRYLPSHFPRYAKLWTICFRQSRFCSRIRRRTREECRSPMGQEC